MDPFKTTIIRGTVMERTEDKKSLGRRAFLKTAALSGALTGALTGGVDEAQAARGRKRGTVPMKKLGTTGASIPIIQLGTSQRLDQTYDRILHGCFKGGVTAIDTALSYGWGSSHRAVATFLKQMGDRRKVWITSKSRASSTGRFAADLDQALKELRVDYLDLYLMHGIDDEGQLERNWLRMGERLKKTGKTRFFGFSCHDGNVVELMNKASRVGGVDVILFRYNFRRYGDLALNRAIDRANKAGIGLVAMKTNGSVPQSAEKVIAFRSRRFTLGQAKLKAVWADERIDSLLSEMDSIRVMRENIAAARSEINLTAGEFHQLNRLAALTAHLSCQGCANLCESAAGGTVKIADTLRFLMYHEAYGDAPRARRLYAELPPAARDFHGADLAAAAAACPQGIDIAGRLEAAHREMTG